MVLYGVLGENTHDVDGNEFEVDAETALVNLRSLVPGVVDVQSVKEFNLKFAQLGKPSTKARPL